MHRSCDPPGILFLSGRAVLTMMAAGSLDPFIMRRSFDGYSVGQVILNLVDLLQGVKKFYLPGPETSGG